MNSNEFQVKCQIFGTNTYRNILTMSDLFELTIPIVLVWSSHGEQELVDLCRAFMTTTALIIHFTHCAAFYLPWESVPFRVEVIV